MLICQLTGGTGRRVHAVIIVRAGTKIDHLCYNRVALKSSLGSEAAARPPPPLLPEIEQTIYPNIWGIGVEATVGVAVFYLATLHGGGE